MEGRELGQTSLLFLLSGEMLPDQGVSHSASLILVGSRSLLTNHGLKYLRKNVTKPDLSS